MAVYNNSYSTLHSHASLRERDVSPLRYRAPFNAQKRQQSLSLPFDRGSIVTHASTRLHSWLHPIAAALRVTARFVARTKFPRRVHRERANEQLRRTLLFCCSGKRNKIRCKCTRKCWRRPHTTQQTTIAH